MKEESQTGRHLRSPTRIDQLVGANVRRLRQERGDTLTGLAAALGISHQQLQKYETGENRLSAGMAYQIAQALSVSIAAVFDGAAVSPGHRLQGETRFQALKKEGAEFLSQARSKDRLEKMVAVLRALSGLP